MGEMADVIGPECVFAAGDVHHFEGVRSVNDPLWMTNYELIYSHPELMIDLVSDRWEIMNTGVIRRLCWIIPM